MSILSDSSILLRMGVGLVVPQHPSHIGPASLDLTLGVQLKRGFFGWWRSFVAKKSFWLWPKEFVLGHTAEWINLPPDLGGLCSGTSTNGRKGVMVENAGWVDPGFCGQLTLEIYNQRWWPVRLAPGQVICQLIFLQTDQPVQQPYHVNGRYHNQQGATVARPPRRTVKEPHDS